MLYVQAVQPLDGYWLRLTLTDGHVVEREVSGVLSGPVFQPVRHDRAVFEAVFVDGGTVAWPGGVDIAPETLIWNGPVPATPDARPELRLWVRQPQ